MENKNLNNEPEKKVSEDKTPEDKIAEELDDEALSKVAGGDSTDKSEEESQERREKNYQRLLKPIIL